MSGPRVKRPFPTKLWPSWALAIAAIVPIGIVMNHAEDNAASPIV